MARFGAHPVVEGVGQKPTFPKPDLRDDVLLKAQVGHAPSVPKPRPPAAQGSTDERPGGGKPAS